MRNPHCEQMFSALLPTSDVIRQRSSWATSITARAVGHCTCGTAATFDEARADFEAAWRVFLSRRTEVDFQEWRDQHDWTARKYAMWEAGEQLPSQRPTSIMRCACGESFDSHRLEESLIHVPHLSAAHEIRRTEPPHSARRACVRPP